MDGHSDEPAPERLLPEAIREKIIALPEYRMGAHRVALTLDDGRVIEPVIVAWGREIERVGDGTRITFLVGDVIDAEDRSEHD
jgi:hypothetical protein